MSPTSSVQDLGSQERQWPEVAQQFFDITSPPGTWSPTRLERNGPEDSSQDILHSFLGYRLPMHTIHDKLGVNDTVLDTALSEATYEAFRRFLKTASMSCVITSKRQITLDDAYVAYLSILEAFAGLGDHLQRLPFTDTKWILDKRAVSALPTPSAEGTAGLPSWTITRYEVDQEEKIGLCFWSDVYRGWWKGRRVAIKVLAETTPRQLFVHEVAIWKTLQHPNVLELLGASSTSSNPPWFFVSPYLKNGSLVSYLKGLPSLNHADVLKMVHQIAKGMAYLHSKDVLHGDLKAANVLMDDKGHCVISDFGQSEMKSEAYRISGMPLPHSTLRWQAPELMSSQSGLTQEVDVCVFAITCIEIMTKGTIPWPMVDDDAVRHFVLRENMRPEPPLQRVWFAQLAEILHVCWHRDPAVRPPFTKIDHDVQELRVWDSADVKESPVPPCRTELEDMHATVQSDAPSQQGPRALWEPPFFPMQPYILEDSDDDRSIPTSSPREIEYPYTLVPSLETRLTMKRAARRDVVTSK